MIFRLIASILFLSLSISALFDLRAELLLSSAMSSEAVLRRGGTKISANDVADKFKRASEAISAPGKSLAHYIQFLRDYSAGAVTHDVRTDLTCEALRTLTRAVRLEPTNAYYLVNWLDLNQLLKGSECDVSFANFDPQEVVSYAVKQAPTEPDVLYSAGLLESWAGRHEPALSYFYKVLLFSTDLSAGRRAIIAAQVKAPQDIEAIIPARFPQAAIWSAHFKLHNRDFFEVHYRSFEKLQLKALNFSAREFEGGEIPYDLHLSRILSLETLHATDAVRKASDSLLTRTRRTQGAVADYLAYRATLDKLDTVTSVLLQDVRPSKAAFVSWNPHESIYLDSQYASIGFFLGARQTMKVIELKSREPARQLLPDQFSLFVSNDNHRWTEYAASIDKIEDAELGCTRFVINLGDSNYRYWKINYRTSSGARSFRNDPAQLVSTYGLKHVG